jgi:DNA-binding winged helix-turn-helix (wHTH) protein
VDGNGSASAFQFGAVTLIPDERRVLKDGRPVSFTPKAFDLLAVLAANPGRLLTKEQLMEAVWPDTVVEESNLAYHVFAIRKALGGSSDADPYIETVPKRGYRFIAPVVRVAADGRTPLPGLEATPAAAAKLQTTDLPARAADAERWANGPLARRGGFIRRRWLGLAAVLMLGGIAYAGLGQLLAPPVAVEPVRFQEPVAGRLAGRNGYVRPLSGRTSAGLCR